MTPSTPTASQDSFSAQARHAGEIAPGNSFGCSSDVSSSFNSLHGVGVVRQRTFLRTAIRRAKFIARFIYWTVKHRSTANAAWVCEYEGYSWK